MPPFSRIAIPIAIPISISVPVPIAVQNFSERDRDFRHTHRSALASAIKDHVFHLIPAKRFRALLTEHPGDGIGYIALPTAIWAHDGGDTRIMNRDLTTIRK